jgi:hypothetical protein
MNLAQGALERRCMLLDLNLSTHALDDLASIRETHSKKTLPSLVAQWPSSEIFFHNSMCLQHFAVCHRCGFGIFDGIDYHFDGSKIRNISAWDVCFWCSCFNFAVVSTENTSDRSEEFPTFWELTELEIARKPLQSLIPRTLPNERQAIVHPWYITAKQQLLYLLVRHAIGNLLPSNNTSILIT